MPSANQFVYGKTVKELREDVDGWHVLHFTDGTALHFMPDVDFNFVMVEAQPQ